MIIGSDEDAGLFLPMRGVDRHHAELQLDDSGAWHINSRRDNLIIQNGALLTDLTLLEDGDRLELGSVSFKFRYFDEEDERYHAALRQLAIRDGLTELYNVRFFADALVKEHEYSFRKQSSLALLFMDIDHFKLVNDRFGHAYGDFVLKELAMLLTTKIRGYDLLARYGGEEFVFLVREETETAVQELAQRICKDVKNHVFNHAGIRAKLTVSIGYFWWDGKDRNTTSEDLLRLADDNLYKAKDAGRNCVVPSYPLAEAETLDPVS
jgi:diguanylate cyclase (GGDEF)-like protein